MLTKKYNVDVSVSKVSGLISLLDKAYPLKNSTANLTITVTADQSAFLNPTNTDFLVSATVNKIVDRKNKDISIAKSIIGKTETFKVKASKESYGFKISGGIEKKEFSAEYIVNIDPTWTKVLPSSGCKAKINKFLSSVEITVEGSFLDQVEGSPTPVNEGSTIPTPTTGSTIPVSPWKDKISKPMVFISGPNYWFTDLSDSEIRKWLTAVQRNGLTGIDIELNGPWPAKEYITKKKQNIKVDEEYKKSFAAMRRILPIARELGLVISIKFLNSNNSNSNSMSDVWWYSTAKAFIDEFGSDNFLIMALNENDPRTRASIGPAILKGLLAAKFPKSQVVAYGARGSYGFSEHHPQKSDASDFKGNDYTTINCSDSGPSIGFFYDNWRVLDGVGGKYKPGTGKIYLQRGKNSNTTIIFYSFRQKPDYELLEEIGKELVGNISTTNPVPVSGDNTLLSVEWASNPPMIKFKYNLKKEDYPTKKDPKNGKIIKGMICVNHKKVEWFKDGQTEQSLKNIYGAEYFQKIKEGDTVTICLKNNSGKNETNALSLVWKGKSTY